MADSFTLIGITLPDIVDDEAGLIALVLDSGFDRVHVRKPSATDGEVEALLAAVPGRLHGRLSLHGHQGLLARFPSIWAHLNAANPCLPPRYSGGFSRSCHSLAELADSPPPTYSFLSPVFDSVSKHGYASSFCHAELRRAAHAGIINERVVALGGVVPDRLPALRDLGFGGAAMLGYLWADLNPDTIKERIDASIYHSHQR